MKPSCSPTGLASEVQSVRLMSAVRRRQLEELYRRKMLSEIAQDMKTTAKTKFYNWLAEKKGSPFTMSVPDVSKVHSQSPQEDLPKDDSQVESGEEANSIQIEASTYQLFLSAERRLAKFFEVRKQHKELKEREIAPENLETNERGENVPNSSKITTPLLRLSQNEDKQCTDNEDCKP
ncbi:unnamed protein product [Calicophoron daubneyi]|uniref:Uncharacterized protein n=1 Tax=Calicophoron daubneyi TaxID=300641 RepID=A0AAV2TQJ4_CALDB